MDQKTIFKKSDAGIEEIRTRKCGLSQRLRQVLILIDGESTVSKIFEKAAGLPDVGQALEELERQGFVEVSAISVAMIKKELIAMAREILGADADSVIGKITDAPETKQGLEAVVASCKKLVRLTINEQKADELVGKCSEILSRL